MQSLQEYMKARRTSLSLSQNEVNKRCEFKPARYAVIERGKEPTEEELKVIQKVLKCSLTGEEDGEQETF